MLKIILFAIISAVFSTVNVYGQILKVNKAELDSDSSKYLVGSVNLNFNINNRGTTNNQQNTFRGFEGYADLVYVSKQNAYILINNINYFKTTGGPLISTGYAHFRTNFYRKRVISYEMFSQVQYDDGRNMPIRYLFGGGFKFQLIDKEKSHLHLGIGVMNETEKWQPTTMESNDLIVKNIWKTSNYLNGHVELNDHINFDIMTYYQGGYDEESDLFRNRISGDAILTVEISDKLSFLTNFSAQYEDRPIIPINNFIYSLTNGLKYSF